MINSHEKIFDRGQTINKLCANKIAKGKMTPYTNHFEHGVVEIDNKNSVMYIATDKIVKHTSKRRNGKVLWQEWSFREDCYNKFYYQGQYLETVYPADYNESTLNKKTIEDKNYIVYRPVYKYPNNYSRMTKHYEMFGTYKFLGKETLPTGQTKCLYVRVNEGANII